jgi:hypothetical protein
MPVSCVTALLLAASLAPGSIGAQAPDPVPRQRDYPDVRSQPLTDALGRLGRAGYRKVRVARQQLDDMPTDVVLWQYPIPNRSLAGARLPAPPDSTEIVLIVVEPVSRAASPSQGVDTVIVSRTDTVFVDRTDTVSVGRADTVFVDRVRVDTVLAYNGPGGANTGLLAALTIGGLGLGGLGGYGIARRIPSPHARPPKQPARGDEARPKQPPLDPGTLAPVLIDEVLSVTGGKAVTHADRTGLTRERPT